MSGFVGIINLDGEPVDPSLLKQMTNSLAFRGPDAQNIWVKDSVGFGHTLLRTTFESESEHQPLSLDGKVWIAADTRIDDRERLIKELLSKGRVVTPTVPDPELILHAYLVWGEACVQHLLGDFAFVIYDGVLQQVFCARDHLGIKPFYYFVSGNNLVVSNSLTSIRLHSKVSNRLNDQAIADFLLFAINCEASTTTFSDIQRIAPAHCLTISKRHRVLRPYWSMPIDEPVYYKRKADYVDRFKELLALALRDRTRTPRVGVLMSGGLDSSSLAAAICQLPENRPTVTAFTSVFDHLIPDDERYYAGLVADRLGIDIHYYSNDGIQLYRGWHLCHLRTPEPALAAVNRAHQLDRNRSLARYGRVFFSGEGPDNALTYEWRPYLYRLMQDRRWMRLMRDILEHFVAHKRILPVATIVAFKKRRGGELRGPEFPVWFNDQFAERAQVYTRWQTKQSQTGLRHPFRPIGFDSFTFPEWQRLFESLDPDFTGVPIEFWHPYLDLRLLRYMLSVPVVPWCRRKYILREAMRGLLPNEVLRRDKAPLIKSPLLQTVLREGMPPLVPTAELFQYVDPNKVRSTTPANAGELWTNIRPIVLNHWLWCVNITN